MVVAGQVVLFQFPQTDLTKGKLRPALLIQQLPYSYDDWLSCMISTKTGHELIGLNEIILPNALDFRQTGLK